jgi:hypothetical protein
MMGVQAASAQLFYDFCLNDHVPSDHLLRSVDGHHDFEGLRLVQFRRTYATPRSGVTAEGTRIYRASKLDCDICKPKAQCCPNAIPRDLDEDTRDVARAHAATPEYVEACRRQKTRDAVCPSQANPAPHALTPKGSAWGKRRVPTCGYRSKLETTRSLKTDQYASRNAGRIAPGMAAQGRPNPSPKHVEPPHQREYLTVFSTVSARLWRQRRARSVGRRQRRS